MLIEPTTSAATQDILVDKGTTFTVRGTLGTGVEVEFRVKDEGSGWKPLYENDEKVTLTDTNMQFVANGSGWIQVYKPATANQCGVEAC